MSRAFRIPEGGIKELKFTTSGYTVLTDEGTDLLDYYSETGASVTTNAGFGCSVGGGRESNDVLTPFDLKTGVTIPARRYSESFVYSEVWTPSQYPAVIDLFYLYEGFFGGELHKLAPSLTATPFTGLYLSTGATLSWIDIPDISADYLSTVLNFSGSYAFLPKMALEANVRWNRDTDFMEFQYRYRWRFAPLSDFFVVYNEERTGDLDTTFRGLIFKIVGYLAI